VLQITAAIFLFLAMRDQAGPVGGQAQRGLVFFFGEWGAVFALFLFGSGVLRLFGSKQGTDVKRSIGLVLTMLSFLGLMHVGAPITAIGPERDALAGAVGFLMSAPFLLFFSRTVGYAALSAGLLTGVVLTFEIDLAALARTISSVFSTSGAPRKKAKRETVVEVVEDDEVQDDAEAEVDDLVEEGEAPSTLNIVRPEFAKAIIKNETQKTIKQKLRSVAGDVLEMKDTRYEEWTFPGLDLLDEAQSALAVDDEQLRGQALLIKQKLAEFEIDVTVRDARPGPTVTQFTLQPSEGVKLSKIANLKDDLALALAAQSLRIEAPIPGKSLVGIEMPNEIRTTVHLREILESQQFRQQSSPLMLPLGRDVSGDAVVTNLADMPHLLIAGATGSGKSVCMNVILSSLLYQNAPDDLKFILIDPKRVELMPYNGIPHLLTPVITEAEKALQALRWAVAEMGRRLHRFSEAGARNIDEYNDKQTEDANMLPRIVVIVDELADLMMRQYRRDTETMIARIAQMARAVGMHLIIATQRPSVDVITGLIKANIPTRIAFRVVSAVDSRTILDGIGAEDLLGKGDMLYMTATTPKPVRVQGIYVSTKEVERVINAVKIAGGGQITEQIGLSNDEEDNEEGGEGEGPDGPSQIDLDASDNGGDDLFFDALRVVQSSKKASASLLQRQLKVGYARAARLLDIMEEKGLIGPADGAKPRQIYMSEKEPSEVA
jgi:S-DNA-T family DNA segregation ATPase FtsK/SpoIIIE